MPRRRMAGIVAPALRLEYVDWLLDGGPRSGPAVDALVAAGTPYDAFLFFDPAPDLRALWRAHRPALEAEWVARGGRGRPWAAQEFGDG